MNCGTRTHRFINDEVVRVNVMVYMCPEDNCDFKDKERDSVAGHMLSEHGINVFGKGGKIGNVEDHDNQTILTDFNTEYVEDKSRLEKIKLSIYFKLYRYIFTP